LVGGAVAAVLAFDPTILYSVPYVAGRPWLGLSAPAEQHLAAAVMMAIDMPAALAAAVWVVSRGRITRAPSTDDDRPPVIPAVSPLLAGPGPQ
jgi:hypothetical protein